MGTRGSWLRHKLQCGLLILACIANASAEEEPQRRNPLGRSPEAVQAGDATFHERCAVCHGQKAEGSMASNLRRARSVRRGPASDLFALVRAGIPGTEMPPQPDLSAEAIWQIVSYLHSLARPGLQPPVEGDVEAGEAVFRQAGCSSCHIVDGSGGFFGPPLDALATRKTSVQIRGDVLEPDRELAEGYETVVVETRSGQRIEGLLKNEDTFEVLILTAAGEPIALRRSDLRSVTKPERSAMPSDFGERLSVNQVQNLLAYLDRQRDPFVPIRRGFGNY